MNYKANNTARYTCEAPTTDIFIRVARFLKSMFETRKRNPYGLSDAMSARLYL